MVNFLDLNIAICGNIGKLRNYALGDLAFSSRFVWVARGKDAAGTEARKLRKCVNVIIMKEIRMEKKFCFLGRRGYGNAVFC